MVTNSRVVVEITPTWWTQNDEEGSGQIGLCINQEQQTHKAEISVEGYVSTDKDSALSIPGSVFSSLKAKGLAFFKPKLAYGYGRQHCTSMKGCIPSGDELTKEPPAAQKIPYAPLDKRSWVHTLNIELDIWFQTANGGLVVVPVMARLDASCLLH